jgi:outer membrane protein OmpA-like peptidoglycan-associated protein
VTPQVALVAEVGSRDFNTGVKVNYAAFTATVAWTKMEGVIVATGKPDGCPKYGRLEVGLTYQYNSRSDRSEATPPHGYVVPPAGPVPPRLGTVEAPTGPASSQSEFRLLPIYFDLDKSTIWPWCADILQRNAEAILARAKAGLKADVIIQGYNCALASEVYDVGLGLRRAEAAKAYLVGLGVDAALLTTETFGNAGTQHRDKAEYYLDRKCEFRWKY